MIISNTAFFILLMTLLLLGFCSITYFIYSREIGSGTPHSKAIIAAINPFRFKFNKSPLLPRERMALMWLFIFMISVFLLLTALKFDYMTIDKCLDNGGCWDKVDKVCRKTESNAQELCNRDN